MAKRHATSDPACSRSPKRTRLSPDRLSDLSDELLLRVLSNVAVYDLTVCQRVSQRLHSIAGDSQLWKAAYYNDFVLPRISLLARLPRLSKSKFRATHANAAASDKLLSWLDDDYLIKGIATNWKRQYKLRHKWSHGMCEVNDILIAARPPSPPLLARLHEGVVYTADSTSGLRAWSYKHDQRLLSTKTLEGNTSETLLPTAFAVDIGTSGSNVQRLVVGFEHGAYSLYNYDKISNHFKHLYSHPASPKDRIYALAFSWPHILTMTEGQTLSLYMFEGLGEQTGTEPLGPPHLMTSLRSHTVWPPLSLSLRIRDSGILAAIAYSLPTYNSGWTVGVQELHLTSTGEVLTSRLASAHSLGFSTLATSYPTDSENSSGESRPSVSRSEQTISKPTSLSYAHPYMLVSHSDNTLTLYMVTSTSTHLSVGPGKRLWGHTSSVFGAQVESRGKAVSVSTRGEEVRVWELERSNISGLRGATGEDHDLSVQVTPERRRSTPARLTMIPQATAERGSVPGLATEKATVEATDVTRGWVGFDESNVVVLREQAQGRQALAVYDFS